ncbi:MAG: flagellar basal body rod protein FlgC [Oscillospiraceae bacterium]|nr:flagellar basal body rod protein FlgC [Oscillospiraceae bacterium]
MGYLRSFDISASALTAQRLRMDVIAQNIANAESTRTQSGEPYRRHTVLFQEKTPGGRPLFVDSLRRSLGLSGSTGTATRPSWGGRGGAGVKVAAIVQDPTDFRMKYDPGHPDADEEGYVRMPNVDIVTEMVNLISASRSYEANQTAIENVKSMAMKTLEIGR